MKRSVIMIMDGITKINKSMVWIMGALIAVVSVLLFVDVLLRYFFSSPTAWAFDLSTWSTGIIAFGLGGYALAMGYHVRIDLFFERFSRRHKCFVDLISAAFLFLMAITLIWLGMDYVIHYYQIDAMSSGGMGMPLWIQWLIVPAGGALIGLQGLVKVINDIYIIITGEELYDAGEGQ
ncbi:TRAP transporter small permease subunit [Salicibibacter cibarius]|uniref:TRAP transporter small permease subunit n=1 Tax=Salicibibacter cibarius TaxID=2743000 RepID=A0A7T6Z3N7_9BACI|nr:TRAP transporter small permease subunit [Salicibibacter cibarius]QQK76438.1 TRAP transporter small permease subunit [Salicibibacter cibarius]